MLLATGHDLTDFERRFLTEANRRPCSFHVVRAVDPRESVELEDVLTGQTHTVVERTASHSCGRRARAPRKAPGLRRRTRSRRSTPPCSSKFMRQHWENWLDERLPALNNQTPRQAARTAAGRKRLEALLAEFEWRGGAPVQQLRDALKL